MGSPHSTSCLLVRAVPELACQVNKLVAVELGSTAMSYADAEIFMVDGFAAKSPHGVEHMLFTPSIGASTNEGSEGMLDDMPTAILFSSNDNSKIVGDHQDALDPLDVP